MLLYYENIVHYLLEKGLIDLESVVKGEFSVRDQSSRNTNFAVNREYSPAYLVKQVRAHDQEKLQTLRIEATCYWLANHDEGYQALRNFLPRYFEYDYLHHILILEFLAGMQNLHEYYRKGIFPIPAAEKLADLMASYHTHESGTLANQKSASLFKKRKPWVFTLSVNTLTDWLNNPVLGNAEKQSVKLILENQEFMDHLQPIGEDWETKSLIHGDVKFPNFLINSDFIPGARPDIRLIDWELADIGDPLWDVAAVVQNYLTLWVASEVEQEYQYQKTTSIVSLDQVQPSIAAFWQRYTRSADWNETTTRQNLQKIVRYTALKLVHSCFESVQGVKDMSLYSAKILQLSLNLLRHPDEAIRVVLGIQTSSRKYETVLS